MPKHLFSCALLLLLLLTPAASHVASVPAQTPNAVAAINAVPAPEDVLGFRPGDDRKLAGWSQTVEYFRRLAASSPRVRFEELGRTTMGAPFIVATISAPENLARLEEYKDIQRRLADPRTLGPAPDRAAEELIRRGKTIVLITCGVHSNEVGSYLSGMLIAHRLASSDEPEVREILRNTIVLLVPSLNPDGVDIVKSWYDRTLGTPYEGTNPPELYHKYVGHDDNRDWYAFTQIETRLTVDKVHNVWHPQIVHDIHQQGPYGSRLFLPPYMQPVEPNVPRQLVEGYTELGHFMADNMLRAGFKGVTWDSTYDAWTPARAYSHYHGGVRILSETASVNIATPLNVTPEQLRAGEGYDARKETPNFPVAWHGGEWHLRDITNYMTTAAFELLKHAARNREAWLRRFYAIGREAVRPRTSGELWGFRVKASANTIHLLDIFDRAGVEYTWLAGEKPVTIAGTLPFTPTMTYPGPTIIVPVAQPYGSFAKAMLEAQHYPDLRDPSGHPIPPYDVTAHTLPLLMGIEVAPIAAPFKASFPKKVNIRRAIPDCLLSQRREIAVYKSHVPSIDEGWTRWALKSSCNEFEEITDEDIRRGNFEQKTAFPDYLTKMSRDKDLRYKTIIIPDQSPRTILEGYRKGTMPEELTGGLGKEGVKALREFVEGGGTLVTLNDASDFAIEQFDLPLRDVTEGLKRTEFYCPGSILRTILDTTHPIAKGMPRESIAWVEDSPVFDIKPEAARARVRVIARYPDSGTPLLSGWLLGAERIRGKAALVEVGLGRGRIYLFGFRPQYRGQSLATYPLLFNAVAPR
ncbi:MAG: hypothetical protein QOE46_52 [Acidobacteriota bacterium]|jgi:hypothetical protein|nr:hypothetical protein [Acidobacteriota bacterium]